MASVSSRFCSRSSSISSYSTERATSSFGRNASPCTTRTVALTTTRCQMSSQDSSSSRWTSTSQIFHSVFSLRSIPIQDSSSKPQSKDERKVCFSLEGRQYHWKRTRSDLLTISLLEPEDQPPPNGGVWPRCVEVLEEYERVKRQEGLCSLDFITLSEYLSLLRLCGSVLAQFQKRAVLYLAAAVSDFYIPSQDVPENKIQSNDGPLKLNLELVPKMLKPLVQSIVPNAFVVSFKLETNSEFLIPKSKEALKKYGHQLVIANLLSSRKREVTMVSPQSIKEIILSEKEVANGIEIENMIVKELVLRHEHFKNSG